MDKGKTATTFNKVEGRAPGEIFPPMGTAEDPVIFGDHHELLLCYQIAPANGGGYAVLAFSNAVHYELNPWNVLEGLAEAKFPFRMWDFMEIVGSEFTQRWPGLRFWTISSNDVMLEIVFAEVQLVHETKVELVHEGPDSDILRAVLIEYLLRENKLPIPALSKQRFSANS